MFNIQVGPVARPEIEYQHFLREVVASILPHCHPREGGGPLVSGGFPPSRE